MLLDEGGGYVPRLPGPPFLLLVHLRAIEGRPNNSVRVTVRVKVKVKVAAPVFAL